MKKPAKTIKIAVDSKGKRYRIRRDGRCYQWSSVASSYPYAAAVDQIEAEGGHVEIEPNPYYEAELKRYEDAKIRRDWNLWLGFGR
ncbi:MAG: hypothetical protein H0U69_03450 [Trueperaceae bacterium]|nr:hypothetical protein [Trueperaceae bacterium]